MADDGSVASERAGERPERRGTRTMLLRESISWTAALLALTGLYGLANAVVQPVNQLTRPGGEVLVDSPDGTAAPYEIENLPAWLQVLSEAEHIGPGIALCLGAWMLRRVLLSIADGAPFHARNPRRLRYVALAVLLGTVLAPVATQWSGRLALHHAGADPTIAHLPLELWGPFGLGDLGVVIVLLAVAEAFRQGRALAEDADGLV